MNFVVDSYLLSIWIHYRIPYSHTKGQSKKSYDTGKCIWPNPHRLPLKCKNDQRKKIFRRYGGFNEKRQHLKTKKNTPSSNSRHTARLRTCASRKLLVRAIPIFHKLRYGLFPHPSYFPNLAHRDYFLSPNMKKWLDGLRDSQREDREIAKTLNYE